MSEKNFSANQIETIKHLNKPMMVLAGPGSGKTTVITYRVKYLIEKHNINPRDILVISFTKASATEMKNRFHGISKNKECVKFCTFHALFFEILREYKNYSVNNIINDFEKKEVLKKIIASENIAMSEEEILISEITNELGLVKNDLLNLYEYESNCVEADKFRNIFNKYTEYKNHYNKIDFDDMLFDCYDLLMNNKNTLLNMQKRYKYILIDEFQDINKVQFETIKMIALPENNIFVVGDDDQSIYRFRGARPEFLLDFPKNYPNTKKIILETNFRSTSEIIKVCNKIISNNEKRYAKDIVGTGKEGVKPVVVFSQDITTEAFAIVKRISSISSVVKNNNYSDIAIIYRNNIQGRALADALANANIPYKLKDDVSSIYNHWIAKDIISYLRLSLDNADNDSFRRIINKPKRYISKDSLQKASDYDGSLFYNLLNVCDFMKKRDLNKLDDLLYNLYEVKKRKPFECVKYIRKIIGYDDYIKDFSAYSKINDKGLFEILDEIQESSKVFTAIEDYLAHAEDSRKRKNENKSAEDFNCVTLSTIHSVKGLEFETVFLISLNEDIIPYKKSITPEEIEEECRLLYVGMTRAKKNLFLMILKTRYEEKIERSRFLKKILK